MQAPNSKRFRWIVFIIFVLLQLGDGLSTYILAVETFYGSDIEANPIVRYTMELVGVIPGLAFWKILAAFIGYFLFVRIRGINPKELRLINIARIVVLSLYAGINIYNWYLIWYVMTA